MPLPRRISGERLDLSRLVPSGRSLGIAFLIASAHGAWFGARETGVFAVRTVDVGGASPRRAPGPQGARADPRHEPAQGRPRRRCSSWSRFRPSRAPVSTVPFLTRSASSSCPSVGWRSSARAPTRTSSRERPGDGNADRHDRPGSPGSGSTAASSSSSASHRRAICGRPSRLSRRSPARTSRGVSAPSRRPPTRSRSDSARVSRSVSATRSTCR